jgi:hypothetical protein
MRRLRDLTDDFGLRENWRRWVDVVERFARRASNRRSIRSEDYERLHQDLIHACRSAVRGGREPERGWGQEMSGIAQPWLTTSLLEHAGALTLQELLRRCQEMDSALGIRRHPFRVGSRLLLVTSGLLFAGAAAGFGWSRSEELIRRLRLTWRPLRLAMLEVDSSQWIVLTGIALAVGGVVLVWRTSANR